MDVRGSAEVSAILFLGPFPQVAKVVVVVTHSLSLSLSFFLSHSLSLSLFLSLSIYLSFSLSLSLFLSLSCLLDFSVAQEGLTPYDIARKHHQSDVADFLEKIRKVRTSTS